MTKDDRCKRLTDCSQCSRASEGVLVHHKVQKGYHYPTNKCTQNCMIFILKGELLVNSPEYPGKEISAGKFILQAIGSKLELLAMTNVELLIYWFNELPQICERRFNRILEISEPPITYTPLVIIPRLGNCLSVICDYLKESKNCERLIEIKCQELVYILTCYYPLPQLSIFFYPISRYTESFHYFVMHNYNKVKSVEEFAHLGGYTTTTFRRLFKNLYKEPVYEWILNKKRKGILDDLQNTKQKVTEISQRYGFDSLSHFAHFCKSSFGDTPRSIRVRAKKGDVIKFKKDQEENSWGYTDNISD